MLTPITLSHNSITLEPLNMAHASDLAEACQDGELWQTVYTSVPSPENMVDNIRKATTMANRVAFAVIDDTTGKAIGTTSFYNIMPKVKRLDIGYTWYAKSYWRTHVNTTCKLLLLTHAFETIDYLTVGWRTDIINTQSQRAIERLGANKDGVIRGDRLRRNGVITDSDVYSMTQDEWTDVKTKLQNKLKRYE